MKTSRALFTTLLCILATSPSSKCIPNGRTSFISHQDKQFLSPTPFREADLIIAELTSRAEAAKNDPKPSPPQFGARKGRSRNSDGAEIGGVTLSPAEPTSSLPYHFQRAQKDRRDEFSPFSFKRSPASERFQGLPLGSFNPFESLENSKKPARGSLRFKDFANRKKVRKEERAEQRDAGFGDGGVFEGLEKLPGPEIIIRLDGPPSNSVGGREGRSSRGRGRSASRFIPPEKLIQVLEKNPRVREYFDDDELPFHRNIQEIIQSAEGNELGGNRVHSSASSEERFRFGEKHNIYFQKQRAHPRNPHGNRDLIRSLGDVTYGTDNPHRHDEDEPRSASYRDSLISPSNHVSSTRSNYHQHRRQLPSPASADLRDLRGARPAAEEDQERRPIPFNDRERSNGGFSRLDLSHLPRSGGSGFQPSLSFPPRERSAAIFRDDEPRAEVHYDPFYNFGSDNFPQRNRRQPQKRLVANSAPSPRSSSIFRESNAYPLYPGPPSAPSGPPPLYHNPNRFLTNFDILGPGGAAAATNSHSANYKLPFLGPNDVDCRNCHDAPRDEQIFTVQVGTKLKVNDDGRPGNRQYYVQDERQGNTRRYP